MSNNNNKSNNNKKKKVVKNPTTTIPHQSHLSDEAEILLDERIRQIRKQVMKDLKTPMPVVTIRFMQYEVYWLWRVWS